MSSRNGKKSELENCPDCDVQAGQSHEGGCDVEICSVCGLQFLNHGGCAGHDPGFARWTGFWPGKLESDFLGIDLNEFNRRGLYEVFFIKPKDGRNLNFESWLEKKIYEKLGFSIEDDDVDLIVDIAREAFTKGRQIERENYEKLHAGQAGNEESAKNTASDAPDERR